MGISIWQLLIVLLIIVLLFGTKKLRNIGGDLGSAIRNFRHSVKEGEEEESNKADDPARVTAENKDNDEVIEGQVTAKQEHKST